MSGATSDCKGHCSHYYICRFREEYERELNKEMNFEKLPSFITPQVSLLCNRQDFREPKDVKYISLGYQSCDTCKHSEVCKNKEGFQNLEDMLEENNTYFELRCPYWSRKELAE